MVQHGNGSFTPNQKGLFPRTYSLDAAVRNVNRLKWNMQNLPGYLRTLRKTYLDPVARSQFVERKRKLRVEELLAQLDQRELERIRLQYRVDNSFWSKYLDARKWLARNIDYAEKFGWFLDPPRRLRRASGHGPERPTARGDAATHGREKRI